MPSIRDTIKLANEMQKHKYKCKCSHTVFIPFNENSRICNYCGRRIFKNKKDEFEFRLKEKMRCLY